ncbi:Uncharacterised protein [Halioglobus japonicus]|nr:Uncharacterised protein [Halioglobus japonicus]
MNELRRMAYLEALEIDSYVSRTQLPGAAVTRRLAIVPVAIEASAAGAHVDTPDLTESVSGQQPEGFTRPDFDFGTRKKNAEIEPPPEVAPIGEAVPRFSLSAIVAGGWLWLEELHGMPLTTEQVHLVQAMAHALALSSGAGTPVAKPETAQFDWPLHNNRQLDQGEDAARASVAAFVSRRLEQRKCRGLVLLGESAAKRLAPSQLDIAAVSTVSSAEILANPTLKKQVWHDLQPLLKAP